MEEKQRGNNNNQNQPVGFSTFQVLTVVMAILVTATLSFLGGVIYERQQGLAYSDEFEVFWEAWDFIDDEFYREPPSVRDRVYGGIRGIITTLGDDYTNVSPPVQAEQSREQIAGKFGGIGAYVSLNEDEEPVITDVISDECIETTPAEQAGLQSDDVIRAVDSYPVAGLGLDAVIDLIKGEAGTDVVLTIYRPEGDETFDVTIRRASVEQITVIDEMYGEIGYLYLTLFNGVATSQMDCKLRNMLAQDPQALILDLRGNGGGFLHEAESIADMFLDEGEVVIQRDREGNEQYSYSSDGDLAEDIPMVVLVDGGSASASEVVAGALQARDRAVLIGKLTFGKGSVQLVHELADGGELRVTAAVWYTPCEGDYQDCLIHGVGLRPDIEFEDEQQFDEEGRDLVLQLALDYITENILEQEDRVESS